MKYNIKILPLADHYVAVTKDKRTGETKGVFNLNESGAEMLSLFIEGYDEESVADILAKRYGIDVAIVKNDVKTFADSWEFLRQSAGH